MLALLVEKQYIEEGLILNHKVGDIVKIRSWKSMENEFGTDSNGDIPPGSVFTRIMKPLCSTYVAIGNIVSDRYRGSGCWLDDWMFDER